MIFRLYEADINNYCTSSSLVFAIYLNRHKKISIISGEIYRNIRQSYTGTMFWSAKALAEYPLSIKPVTMMGWVLCTGNRVV